MHTRYPLRRTLYRKAPGADKARMRGATAQKIRKAKELEGGKERWKRWNAANGLVISPTPEQSVPLEQQSVSDIPQVPQPSHRIPLAQTEATQR